MVPLMSLTVVMASMVPLCKTQKAASGLDCSAVSLAPSTLSTSQQRICHMSLKQGDALVLFDTSLLLQTMGPIGVGEFLVGPRAEVR